MKWTIKMHPCPLSTTKYIFLDSSAIYLHLTHCQFHCSFVSPPNVQSFHSMTSSMSSKYIKERRGSPSESSGTPLMTSEFLPLIPTSCLLSTTNFHIPQFCCPSRMRYPVECFSKVYVYCFNCFTSNLPKFSSRKYNMLIKNDHFLNNSMLDMF